MKRKIPILLVEDDQVDVMLITRGFRELQLNHPVTIAANGEEALKLLQNDPSVAPKLILLDLNMPRMNGIEFLQIIKEDEQFRKIPVVVLTGSKEENDVSQCFKLGAAGYISKPIKFEDVLKVLKTIDRYWSLSQLPTVN